MMKMSMMDHYPAKKRRLVLSRKMSTRSSSTHEHTPSSTKSKDECETMMMVKKSSPGNISTDDSTVEIHWDNNSPSPSPAMKNRRKQRKKRANDLSTLIKQIPKTRKQENADAAQAVATDNAFTTWMQQNLASGPRRSSYSLRQNTTTRSSGSRGSKEEALDFSEKVKQFLSQAPFDISSQKLSQNNMRASPTIVTRSSQRSQASSPSYFSNSSADSLMMKIDNDLEDSILAELDKVAPSKTPVRNCRLKNRQTPRLTRSTRKRVNRPVPKLSQGASTSTTIRKSLPISKPETCSQRTCNKKTKAEDKNLTEIVNRNNENLIDLDENDEIDEILSTQPNILQNNVAIETGEVKMNLDEKISNMKIDRKKTSTPLQKNVITKTLPKTPDLLVDNEADEFDDILANFDMEEIKCKSQETPARLTADQRKLKTKCHTSPLPLNNCYKDRIDPSKSFIPIAKTTDQPTSSNKLDSGIKQLSINSPLNGKRKCPVPNPHQSFVKTGMVTNACRKPFVPPKQQPIFNNRFPLEISAIEGKSGTGGNEPVETSLSVLDSTFNPFSSTQKCTMEEIEQKRKYAQMKLRERLRRKRSK